MKYVKSYFRGLVHGLQCMGAFYLIISCVEGKGSAFLFMYYCLFLGLASIIGDKLNEQDNKSSS